MPIGKASRSGPKIGVGHAEGSVGAVGKHMYGDSLGPGASVGKPRSAYWMQYPSTTSSTSTTTSTFSTTSSTTTTSSSTTTTSSSTTTTTTAP